MRPLVSAKPLIDALLRLQVHLDGMMKLRHFASRGDNSEYASAERRLPLETLIYDRDRDILDAQVAELVAKRTGACVPCHNFKADRAEMGCALHVAATNLPPCMLRPVRFTTRTCAAAACMRASSTGPCRASARKVDRAGLFGVTCDHGILLIGVMMNGPEHWRYASMCFSMLFSSNVVPRCAYYDINCSYADHCRRFIAAHNQVHAGVWSQSVVEAAEAMAMPLPVFHKNMHNAGCRARHALINSSFAPDLQPDGEPAETYWSELGPAKALRFMTLDSHTITVESTVAHINQKHDERTGEWLRRRARKLQRLQGSIADAIADAQRHLPREPEVCASELSLCAARCAQPSRIMLRLVGHVHTNLPC